MPESPSLRVVGRRVLPFPFGAVVGLVACASPVAPSLERSVAPDWARAAEIVVEVDLDRGTAGIVQGGQTLGRAAVPVALAVSSPQTTAVGVDAPAGRRRVHLTVGITTAERSVRLGPSSRLRRPPGQDGVLVIPHETTVVALPGGVSVRDGTTLLVELPSAGRVVPSPDFDGDGRTGAGAPFPFFDQRTCSARPDGACYRYETFSGARESRDIGFDVEPTVRRFRARLLVAADVLPP